MQYKIGDVVKIAKIKNIYPEETVPKVKKALYKFIGRVARILEIDNYDGKIHYILSLTKEWDFEKSELKKTTKDEKKYLSNKRSKMQSKIKWYEWLNITNIRGKIIEILSKQIATTKEQKYVLLFWLGNKLKIWKENILFHRFKEVCQYIEEEEKIKNQKTIEEQI